MPDTRTLREIADIVGDMVMNGHVMNLVDDWDLINGSDVYYEDEETGRELTPVEREAYLRGEYPHEVFEAPTDIHQHFIITRTGADYLLRRTDEIVYYSPSLEMYIWAIDDFGTPWEGVTRTYYENAKPGLFDEDAV